MVAEIGPVALFQQERSFARVGAFLPQTFRILRFVSKIEASPHRDPLADLLYSGGHLW